MYTLAPRELALENGDPHTRVYRRDGVAPGMSYHDYWTTGPHANAVDFVETASLLPNGIHNLVMYPFGWRNPVPDQRPLAWNYHEAVSPAIQVGDYGFGPHHDMHKIYELNMRPASYEEGTLRRFNEIWQQGLQNIASGLTKGSLPDPPIETWWVRTRKDGESYAGSERIVVPYTQYQARTLLEMIDRLQNKLTDRILERDQHPDFTEDGLRAPWLTDSTTYRYLMKPELNADDIRPILFTATREMAVSLGLNIEDQLYYLEGIDEHLARPFMWYFHHSLNKVLKRSDYYQTQSKRSKEFMGAVSEIRQTLLTNRKLVAHASSTIWLQLSAEAQGVSLPFSQDEIQAARLDMETGLKNLVRWYLTFPAVYEDLVLSHNGPGAAEVTPDGLDFDERLSLVRQDLSASRRARHLLRT